MLRFHRLASAVALALVTVALLAPVAQARPVAAGSGTGGSTAPAVPATTSGTPKQATGGGTDWNAVFAGAAGSAIIIAMCAGGIGLVRRRALAA
ncbi:MAG TPA: hypothetical protein VH459_06290 [Gaiellales bacterium]